MTGRMGEAECLGEDSWVEEAGDPPDIRLPWSFAWDSAENFPHRNGTWLFKREIKKKEQFVLNQVGLRVGAGGPQSTHRD